MSRYPKIVNVYLNSNNKISGTNNNATYNIDWGSVLKNNTRYRLHFTYMGGMNTFSAAMTNKIACIYSDIQTSSNRMSSTNGAMTTQMMGYLKIQQVQPNVNAGYLTAEDNTNVPMYLDSRPLNNTFTISILDNQATPALYLDVNASPAVPGNYIMVLSFQEIEEESD